MLRPSSRISFLIGLATCELKPLTPGGQEFEGLQGPSGYRSLLQVLGFAISILQVH